MHCAAWIWGDVTQAFPWPPQLALYWVTPEASTVLDLTQGPWDYCLATTDVCLFKVLGLFSQQVVDSARILPFPAQAGSRNAITSS